METKVKKDDMNIVIVGHVDHGKSTLIGRLLADTGSLPEGKLDQVKEECRRNSKPFEYAFLLDALKDERSQGITIDTSRCFFQTKKRKYTIFDAPGHMEFLKNMITGAARAQAAILIIDVKEGVQENSRRHGYMLSMLGIKHMAIAINKMDLVSYSAKEYEKVKLEYTEFLSQLNINPDFVLPVSAINSDNIITKSENMPWYKGMSILEIMDSFSCEEEKENQVFRMPVQDVYKFTRDGDDRRIVVGTVDTGSVRVGDEIVFYPSRKKSNIKSIESFHTLPKETIQAGMAAGFTLQEQIYITRGELMTIASQKKPKISSIIYANIFWLSKKSLNKESTYYLKVGCEKVKVKLEEVVRVINSSDLHETTKKNYVECNEVAECILKTDKAIAFDLVKDNAATSRFVIVDHYEIAGGGIITQSMEDSQYELRDRIVLRNNKWEPSEISKERRAERYCQKPILMVLTGAQNVGKKELAKALEKELFESGRLVYYLGIASFLYGMNSDVKLSVDTNQEENIRRFAEVANLLLDAGLILIITVRNLTQKDLDIMKMIITDEIDLIWVGEEKTTDAKIDIRILSSNLHENVSILKDRLKEKESSIKFNQGEVR